LAALGSPLGILALLGVFGARPKSTVFVLLDYCGGERTDALYGRIAGWNPGATIYVLDNASPHDAPSCATHRNAVNSYVGGGIRDCVAIAKQAGAEFLFLCTNDVEILDRLSIAEFEAMALADPDVAMISCALSGDSCQANAFPWMVRRTGKGVRQIHHSDLNCCLFRLAFIESYGGFPPSLGGWGYAHEISYHAKLQSKKILLCESCTIRHLHASNELILENGDVVNKQRERIAVYSKRYGDWRIPTVRLAGLFAEARAAGVQSVASESDLLPQQRATSRAAARAKARAEARRASRRAGGG
jgi:hypothetical protein